MPREGTTSLGDHFRSLERLALECGDETWRKSQRPLARGTTTFVGETIRSAIDLGDAMRRIARAYDVVHGGSFNRVERRSDRVVYRIDDQWFPFDPNVTGDDTLSTMETVLVFVHAMLSLVAGSDLQPHVRCVRVRRPHRPVDVGSLAFWTAPVRFGASRYQIEYAPAVAAMPLSANFAGFGTADVWAQAVRTVERRSVSTMDDVVDRVRAAIAEGSVAQPCVARRLGLSVATLRRRLDTCGYGFREIRAEVLDDEARRLLAGGRDAAEVAGRLGFSDQRSFSRAFKNRNGLTPCAYVGHRDRRVSELVLPD